ncbi:hypothetical protein HYV49_03660 [Candidatus Pacearchaeota archaeon]|nr:hypothetical protein [Candidatus Pacearchaeota archaeon]
MDKKGIFFTLVTVIMLTIFIITVSISQFQRDDSIVTRVSTMESFLSSLDKDLERRTYIFGIRAVLSMESEILSRLSYINNFDSVVEELFFNASINGKFMNISDGITYNDTLKEVNFFARKFNVIVKLDHKNITMYQNDPWHVVVNWTVNLTMEDIGNLARWEKTESYVVKFSIENFEDTIYVVGTNGSYTNVIKKTPYEGNYVSGSDVINFSKHVNNSYYTNFSNAAPSFLDRIQGNIGANSPYGIESFVNLLFLSQQGISTKDKTAVDHIYFSISNPSARKLQGMPSWFKIDNEDNREERYNTQGVPNG